MILNTVSAWSKKWRMMINCQPDKTEVIAFNTAEKDQALVPSSFKLGENKINRVHHTNQKIWIYRGVILTADGIVFNTKPVLVQNHTHATCLSIAVVGTLEKLL